MIDNGVILIDKPSGMTSFGVVARVRRVLSKETGKKAKVGHCGTLDPFATGLMIIVTGKECKNAGNYSKLDKVYQAEIILGQTSTTGDTEGEITKISDRIPSKQEIEDILRQFIGKIEQKPPIFSAIKINGERAYKLARKGAEIDMPTRQIEIFSLDLIDYSYPVLKIETHVSSGTYIRTLAEDIGQSLGIGAYCYQLRRLKIGKYDIKNAKTLKSFGIND